MLEYTLMLNAFHNLLSKSCLFCERDELRFALAAKPGRHDAQIIYLWSRNAGDQTKCIREVVRLLLRGRMPLVVESNEVAKRRANDGAL